MISIHTHPTHLHELARLVPVGPAARQVVSFAVIGVASTIAYVLAYAALRTVLGAPLANGLALVTTAIGNTGSRSMSAVPSGSPTTTPPDSSRSASRWRSPQALSGPSVSSSMTRRVG